MFNCVITVYLPLQTVEDSEPWHPIIAQYDFDPGLYEGDSVRVHEAPFCNTRVNGVLVKGDGPSFSFVAMVKRREKIIGYGEPSKLTLEIELEIADKEQIPEIIETLVQNFPGRLKRAS